MKLWEDKFWKDAFCYSPYMEDHLTVSKEYFELGYRAGVKDVYELQREQWSFYCFLEISDKEVE